MIKLPLICTLALLLPSCSLFQTTPDPVIKGQRAVYQSVLIGEASAMKLIDRYVEDCKKLVAYHENYIMQLDIDDTMQMTQNPEERARYHRASETNRDKKLKRAYDLIDKRVVKMRANVKKHYSISLRLVGSVYNYLSTSPIEIDNMEFWINKLDQISNQKEDVK